jgi:hypothetical protein
MGQMQPSLRIIGEPQGEERIVTSWDRCADRRHLAAWLVVDLHRELALRDCQRNRIDAVCREQCIW